MFNRNITKERLEIALSELLASNQVILEKKKNIKGAPTKLYRFFNIPYELNEFNEFNTPAIENNPIKFVNSFNSLDSDLEMEVFDI